MVGDVQLVNVAEEVEGSDADVVANVARFDSPEHDTETNLHAATDLVAIQHPIQRSFQDGRKDRQ
ncbi:MAG: hypothetical protein A2V70_04510 [Planctomycetes bacterium RBG_13_63_9]|nr:MAG: hypothetical protein A2V70_04510 [Planctomycetes bacterium RBG_13_63_9]